MNHALLSPSSSPIWLACPPSARLQAEYPDSPNDLTAQGTVAHALAEYKLKRLLHKRTKRPTSDLIDAEMHQHTDDYAAFCLDLVPQSRCKSFVEQRVDLSDMIPEAFGTVDFAVVTPQYIHIVDFKYGELPVSAYDNPQLKLYALGVHLNCLPSSWRPTTVKMTIMQPRVHNMQTCTMSTADLLRWAYGIIPIAHKAFRGEGELNRGPHCMFCKAQAICRAKAEVALMPEHKEPQTLTDHEIEALLPKLDGVAAWAKKLQAYALKRAQEGHIWPGYTIGETSTKRTWSDTAAVLEAAKELGISVEKTALISPAEAEKILGNRFSETLSRYVTRPAGKPALKPDHQSLTGFEE
jgi:hypothetical protein